MHFRLIHPSSVAVVCPTTPWSDNASVATAVVAVVAVGSGFEVVGEFCSGTTASAARTQRSLSQKGLRKSKALENSVPESGCPTWIRTMTNRFRDCCATITPSGSRNRSRERTRN